jgi:hypothetical protein
MKHNAYETFQPASKHRVTKPALRVDGAGEPVLVSYESLRRERLIQRIVTNLRTRDVATLESLICLLGADEESH